MRLGLLCTTILVALILLAGSSPRAAASWRNTACPNTPPQPISPGVYPVCFITFTSDDSLTPHTSGTVVWNGNGNVSTVLTITNSGNQSFAVTVIQIDAAVLNSVSESLGTAYFTPVEVGAGNSAQFPSGLGESVSDNVIVVYYVIATADTKGLQSQVTSLQSQVASLQSKVSSLEANLTSTRENLTLTQSQLSSVEQQLSISRSNASSLSSEASRLQATVTSDNTEIQNITSTLNAKSQQLSATELMLSSAQSSLRTYSDVYLPLAVLIPTGAAVVFSILYFRARARRA